MKIRSGVKMLFFQQIDLCTATFSHQKSKFKHSVVEVSLSFLSIGQLFFIPFLYKLLKQLSSS